MVWISILCIVPIGIYYICTIVQCTYSGNVCFCVSDWNVFFAYISLLSRKMNSLVWNSQCWVLSVRILFIFFSNSVLNVLLNIKTQGHRNKANKAHSSYSKKSDQNLTVKILNERGNFQKYMLSTANLLTVFALRMLPFLIFYIVCKK